MRLVANGLNGQYLSSVLKGIDRSALESIEAAVAYTTTVDELAMLAKDTSVPFILYTLADGNFPSPGVVDRFLIAPVHWQLFLTRNFFHPKVLWLRGVGAYIGSANLTQQAWWQNIECGVWMTEDELEEQGLDDALRSFFAELGTSRRFVHATKEHLEALRKLGRAAKPVSDAEAAFKRTADEALAGIPGTTPVPAIVSKDDDTAIQQFVAEWDSTLTILRKLSEHVASMERPSWVANDVHPSIIQDQATELYWHQHIRRNGVEPAETMMWTFHARNQTAPEAAVEEALREWLASPGGDSWAHHVNVAPRVTRELLARDAIAALTVDDLTTIILNTHAAREHARQALKKDLGDVDGASSRDERCRLLAELWLRERTASGRNVREVLQYVIWGDAMDPRVGARLWRAAHDPDWKIRRLGLSILGELVGYARPNEYPPRNHRVSKTLVALGFRNVTV